MVVLIALFGCSHRVSTWKETPPAAVALPDTQVAVVADERACRRIADEVTKALAARPGFSVSPQAEARLVLRNCATDVRADVDIRIEQGATGVDERAVRFVGTASTEVVIAVAGTDTVLSESVVRDSGGRWDPSRDDFTEGAFIVQGQLFRDLGEAVAQRVAPLPETIKRRMYHEPEPGTAKAFHNDAVQAEQRGDLHTAYQLAIEAYAANPTPRGMAYIEELKRRAEDTGYALSTEDSGSDRPKKK